MTLQLLYDDDPVPLTKPATPSQSHPEFQMPQGQNESSLIAAYVTLPAPDEALVRRDGARVSQ